MEIKEILSREIFFALKNFLEDPANKPGIVSIIRAQMIFPSSGNEELYSVTLKINKTMRENKETREDYALIYSRVMNLLKALPLRED